MLNYYFILAKQIFFRNLEVASAISNSFKSMLGNLKDQEEIYKTNSPHKPFRICRQNTMKLN